MLSVGSASNTYEILAKLAEGGMAELFIARNATGAGVERLVVLKRMLPECAHKQELAQLFIHEARLAAQLNHANIAKVLDVGALGSSVFFTMEYVHGVTVRELMLHARGAKATIPFAAFLTIAAGAAAGLHHAHERRGIDGKPLGIVHSDVSPSNLMISDEGEVKLVDFGIARAAGSTANSDGTLRGKISYLSPEQCHTSRAIDRRSDLYSLGIVLWEMLTLQGLYRRASDFENMVAIESEPTTRPSQFRKDVPPQLDAIVMRLLEKDPRNRFQTAGALLEEIERVAGQLRVVPSVSGLSRLVTDWFGKRQEPWLEETGGGTHKRLVVASEPVPTGSQLVKTLGSPVDDQLKTLQPTRPSAENIPSDTIPDARPSQRGKSESLEAMRDRLFKKAQERKTPDPESDPEDANATIPRIPVEAVIRYDTPRDGVVVKHRQPPTPAQPASRQPFVTKKVVLDRKSSVRLVVIGVVVIVLSVVLALLVARH